LLPTLTRALQEHLDDWHGLDELTMLTTDNDPFRQDTETGHAHSQRLRESMERLGVEVGPEGRKGHMRGPALHAHRAAPAG